MAANNYYHSDIPQPPAYDRATPSPYNHDPSVAPAYSYAHHDDPTAPQYFHESTQSFMSGDANYQNTGRVQAEDEYADNIPLSTKSQFGNHPGYMHQPTAYPVYSEPAEELGRGGKRRRLGFFKKKPAWVTWTLTLVQVIVFIVELVKAGQLTGSPIQTKPSFNPMIGPSSSIQILLGARYDPCMKNIPRIQNATQTLHFPCPNVTSNAEDCTLREVCGFGGVPDNHANGSLDDPAPNQWWRFIVPIFLHAGFIHIGFNLLVQMTMGADMERMVGIWRYTLTYFASGIFGFVLGGNYAAQMQPSDGCSGALFGILALTARPRGGVDYHDSGCGRFVRSWSAPGLRQLRHLGGFAMGLAIGLTIMRSPNALRERIGLERQPYVAMSGGAGDPTVDNRKTTSFADFFKKPSTISSVDDNRSKGPLDFFRGRKPLWWAWWIVRAGALVAVCVGFILLIIDFYKYPTTNCSWCYRLSCLPVNGWCEQGKLQIKQIS
ncbi:hypothetical protein N7470_003563 [Penicillium chermesinum]|nr:hypothetical protein N7470_003563 [Penicillium chermesinum]